MVLTLKLLKKWASDNIFIFGLTVDEVKALDAIKAITLMNITTNNAEIKACLDWLDTDYFTPGNPGELAAVETRSFLEGGDPYKVLADLPIHMLMRIEALDKCLQKQKTLGTYGHFKYCA